MIERREIVAFTATPTVDTSIYAAKDSIGGLLTFTHTGTAGGGTGVVKSVTIADKSDNAVEYDLVLFKGLPTGTITDQAAFDPTDADLANILAVINIASSDHFSFADNGVSTLSSLNSEVMFSFGATSRVIYGALVARGTPTYAAASDVTLTIYVAVD